MKKIIDFIKNLKIDFFKKDIAGNIVLYSNNDFERCLTIHFFMKKEYWDGWGMKYIHYDGCHRSFEFGPFFVIAWSGGYTKKCDTHDGDDD